MRRVKRYFLNALLLSGVSILMQTVSVSFNVYVSGRVGAEGMGLLTLIFTVTGFATTLAASGVQLAVVKMTAEVIPYEEARINATVSGRVRNVMRASLLYSTFFGVLAAVLLFSLARVLAIHALGDVRALPSLRLYAVSLPFIAVASALNGYFSGVRRVHKNVAARLGEQGVKVYLTSLLLASLAPSGVTYACAAVVGGGAVSEMISLGISALLYIRDRRKFFVSARESEKDSALKPLISIAFPVALSTYARSALLTVEHLAIPWGLKQYGVSSSAALASYGILHGMVFPLLLFPSAVLSSFAGLLIPEMAECHASGQKRRIEYITARMFQVSLIFSIGVAGIFVCFSHEIGTVIYGSTEAAEHIRVLAPLIPLMYLDGAVDSILKGLGQQLYSMKVNITDSLTGILMVVILLPHMGIRGYRLVIFVCEALNASLSILKLLEVTGLRANPLRWIFKPLLAVVGATLLWRPLVDHGILLSLLADGRSQLIGGIIGAALVYLIFILLLGSISREDIGWARGILRAEKRTT
ncbi:MAG: polysaccharide biosynthesis C-terminal domain-containing protein [Clostridia bacterium]|nr:polysaccharide biosynthesis C-terminal domain-containing protein [Clostridia bacterium]